MRRDRNRNLFTLFLVLVLLLGGVLALSGSTMEPADFTFINGTEPESLDPKIVSGVPEGRILRGLFEGLTNPHPATLEPLPGMAERWEISEDGRTYTFHIRKEARWSDGSPVTAHDFFWSWKRFLDPEFPAKYAQLLWLVKNGKAYNHGDLKDFDQVGIRVPEKHTFVVELEDPTGYFIHLTHFYPLFPVHRKSVEAHPGEWHHPQHLVCNGPFLLHTRAIRERIRMVKNPRYWDADNVKLNIVDALPVEDQVTALNLYLTGVVDWATDVPLHIVKDLIPRDDFNPVPYLGIYYYQFNLKNKNELKRRFLGDRRTRLALYLAMDREAIVSKVTRAGEVAARTFVPPGIPGYESPRLPGHDPGRARKLVAEVKRDLGIENVPTLTILYNTHEAHKDIAEVIMSQWNKTLGLSIKIENQEWGTYMSSRQTLNYDICRAAWIGDYLDPNTFLDMWLTGGGNNNTGYAKKEYDDLIRKAAREPDPERRMEILKETEAMLLEDLPVIPIYYYVTKNLVRPWVKGFHLNIQNVHPMKFIWIDKALKESMPLR